MCEWGECNEQNHIPQEDGVYDDDDYDYQSDSAESFHFLSDNERDYKYKQGKRRTLKGRRDTEEDGDTEGSLDNSDGEASENEVNDVSAKQIGTGDMENYETSEDTEEEIIIEKAEDGDSIEHTTNIEDSKSNQDLVNTEIKPIRREMVGKDTFLRVRCRKVEDGYEAEDSLMYVQ